MLQAPMRSEAPSAMPCQRPSLRAKQGAQVTTSACKRNQNAIRPIAPSAPHVRSSIVGPLLRLTRRNAADNASRGRGTCKWMSCSTAPGSTDATKGDASEASKLETSKDDVLEQFLSWAVANGIQGVGRDGDKVGLFQGDAGERGLLALRDLAPGDELLRIPLRLALTDHPDDNESNELLFEGAPWSIRLAAKILREKAKGSDSPWHKYLAVLPASVPSPLTTFSWEEMQEIQYQPALSELYETDWMAADAYERCSEEAIGGATEEEFRWALSVVHSRTFGSAAEKGGVGVRMLVPLIDMINHAGDWGGVARGLGQGEGDPEVEAQDLAEWELLSPGRSASGEWEMCVKAIREAQEGQEIVMSYGERDNGDFILHYGFVPEANPHDCVELFSEGPEAAIEWWANSTGLDPNKEDVQTLARGALEKAHAADGGHVTEAGPEGNSLRVLSGGRVDRRLLAAFEHMAAGGAAAVGSRGKATRAAAQGVAGRCWEVLSGMPTSLQSDLQLLAGQPEGSCDTCLFGFLAGQHETLLAQQLKDMVPAPKQEVPLSGGDSTPPAPQLTWPQLMAVQFRAYKKLILWDALRHMGPPAHVTEGEHR